MSAYIYVDGKEYELADVTQVHLAHTEAAGGTMVSLKMGNQVLGYLNAGPGCFVTVGNRPTKVSTTLTLKKTGGTLTMSIPDTGVIQPVETVESIKHLSLQGTG
jgi:hypothetical protein